MAGQVGTFEQFIKFGTDAHGIERTLRLLQALTTLLLFSSPLRHLLSLPTTLTPGSTLSAVLPPLRKRLATLRQPLRFFRFLDSFSSAWAIFSSSSSPGNGGGWRDTVERWTDFGGKVFTGMYLLLESMVFVEVVLDVPGLGVWGSPERVAGYVVDGQRFWFFGLVCGVLGALVRLGRPSLVRGKGREVKGGVKQEGKRGIVAKKEDAGGKRGKIVRRLVADVMDLGLPGSVVGWVPLPPETVGWLMLGSTVLTGMEVWERCGRELAAAKAVARAK